MRQGSERIRIALKLLPVGLLLGLSLVFPMLALFRASFLPGTQSFDHAGGFSLAQYAKIFGDWFYLTILLETLWIGFVTATVCLLLGFPVGYHLARLLPKQRQWRLILVILPLTLSLVIVVFGWLVILGRNGLLNSFLVGMGIVERPQRFLYNWHAVVLVLVQQFLPFVILSVMSVCAQIDVVLEQAAANLRANRWTTFRRVVIPLAMPGILAGFTLVFILASSAFITPRMVGGGRVQMIGNLVLEQVLVVVNWPFGSALGFIMLVGVLGLTAAISAGLTRLVSQRSPVRAR